MEQQQKQRKSNNNDKNRNRTLKFDPRMFFGLALKKD